VRDEELFYVTSHQLLNIQDLQTVSTSKMTIVSSRALNCTHFTSLSGAVWVRDIGFISYCSQRPRFIVVCIISACIRPGQVVHRSGTCCSVLRSQRPDPGTSCESVLHLWHLHNFESNKLLSCCWQCQHSRVISLYVLALV